jgi:16S rRNA pseudouridine516 synthase
MFEVLDTKVTFLKRLAMGPLKLDEDLAYGEYRYLTEDEINTLKRRPV